jgi:hypothetical protein
MEKTSNFKPRAFVSMSMLIFIIVLGVTGISMEIIEAAVENAEITPSFLESILHFLTATHVLVGFSFVILSIIHIIINWGTLKNYFKTRVKKINKEAIIAFFFIQYIKMTF